MQKNLSLENYHIQKTLSEDSFSTLYQGTFSTQDAVIKVWHHLHTLSPEQQMQIQQEVQRYQTIQHPSLLPILDVVITQQKVVIISPFEAYGSLDALLRQEQQRPLPIEKALNIVVQIGQALLAAHEQGIVHGRITPPNLFFTSPHTIALGDFQFPSILAHIDAPATLQHKQDFADYLAPEQDPGQATKLSDQYMLGCLAYRLLTGYTPATLVARVAGSEPQTGDQAIVPLRSIYLAIPLHVEQAIMRALATNPADRHSDIQTFLQGLDFTEAAQSSEAFVTTPPLLTLKAPDAHLFAATKSGISQSSMKLPSAFQNVTSTTVEWKNFKTPPQYKQGKPIPRRLVIPIILLAVFCIVACSVSALAPALFKGSAQTPTEVAHVQLTIIQTTGTATMSITPTATKTASTPTPTSGVTPTPAPVVVPTPTPQANPVKPTPVAVPSPTTTPTPIVSTQPTPSGSIRPVFECVEKQSNDDYILRFGYRNDNPSTVTIPLGAMNMLFPDTYNGQQPITFSAGRQYSVMQVHVHSGGMLVWVLNGATATGSAFGKRC